jgi:uncharacterized membrane protein
MESTKEALEFVAISADLAGLAILLIGAFKFLGSYVAFEFKGFLGRDCATQIQNLRLPLGSYILLSLEFMIISDIIHSALSRTLDDFLLLGLLVAIRTAIGFFLSQELKETREER